jgi:hypothetical protein
LARSLGRRGIYVLRPLLFAAFGALAWLLWLAGPSQATDVMPGIPAVPAPSVSLPPVPLADPLGRLVNQDPSGVAVPSQLATVPGTVVRQLTDHALTPVVGVVHGAQRVVTNTLKELAALPEGPSVPELPRVPGILRNKGASVPAVPAAPPRAGPGAALTGPSTLVHTKPVPPAVQAGSRASTRTSGFPDGVVFAPPAVFAASDVSTVPGGPPPDAPAPAAASPHEAGSMSGPEGGSTFGAADLPEQRGLAPPPGHCPIPDRRQTPSTEPAFDPGSSPD